MARSIAPQIGRIHLSRPTTHDRDFPCNRAADHTYSHSSGGGIDLQNYLYGLRGHIWTRLVCKSLLRWSSGKRRIHISGLLTSGGDLHSGHNGICASSPYQVIGLLRPGPLQVLKKLVSPVAPLLAAQASPWESFSTSSGLSYAARRYSCSRAISDQMMRAFLLATATQAFDVPSRCCLSLIQRLRWSVLAFAR